MKIWMKLAALFRREKLDAEMAEEMRLHLEQRTQENITAGMSPDEARYAARRQFGGVDQIKETAREQRGWLWFEQLSRDVRFTLRQLVKSPGFTTVAVLTLALGIGLNTAMFSVLNGLLLRPLSYPQPERLFRLHDVRPQDQSDDFSAANFTDIAQASGDVAELAAFRFWAFTLTEPNTPADLPIAMRVSANFFNVLGKAPRLGRTFFPDESTVGKDPVAVISHQYWQSHFRGDPQIVGRMVRLDSETVEIIGVLAADDEVTRVLAPVALFRPLVWKEAEQTNRSDAHVGVIGRFRNDVTPERAAAAFQTIASRLASDHPVENKTMDIVAQSLQGSMLRGSGRVVTFVLVGLSSFVLLIACANLANLLLVRALSRAREFSIRGALGASRLQLIKPLVIESFLLAAIGGLAAMLVSTWTTSWLTQYFGSPEKPANFSMDGRVLLFTAAASLLTALLFGIAPAWWAARVDLNDSLKSGARGQSGNRAQNRYRQMLIVTQFALALVLLVGADFFMRGLGRLLETRAGWNPEPVIYGVLNLASNKYNEAEPIIAFHTELHRRLVALPGVANASVSFEIPMDNSPAQRAYRVEGREPPPPGQETSAFTNAVSASYFDTVGTRLLRGRFIDETDQQKTQPVVVINDAMARALFPSGDALGQRIGLAAGEPFWAVIVGIVEDTKPMYIRPSSIRFQVYKPFTQEAWQYVTIAVRASDPAQAATLIEPIRKVVASLDADQPINRLKTVPDIIRRNFGAWRAIKQLLILFAGLGLLLAALGIYAVIARLVAQRTGEIGIRLALGAQVLDIFRLVVGNGLRLSIAGTLLGLLGGFYFARFLARTMPAFGEADWMPVIGASFLLVLVAAIACVLPARRAMKVNPLVALRSE